MKIRTGNEIREFNEALEKCTSLVWLMGPDDECYNMKDADEYIDGILRITEKTAISSGSSLLPTKIRRLWPTSSGGWRHNKGRRPGLNFHTYMRKKCQKSRYLGSFGQKRPIICPFFMSVFS